MNPNVLKRFILIAATLLAIAAVSFVFFGAFLTQEPGDYEVRRGDLRLSEGNYDEALASFNEALERTPNHRGALMGRAVVFIQTGQVEEAEAELDYLIDFLNRTLEAEDLTGYGTLAAAYANRGVIKDRAGRHEEALQDYIKALETDEGAVEGPGIFDQIIYGYKKSTVRDRAQYLAEQFLLPEEERVLLLPPKHEEQRLHKP
jgi:tetratricopeptide (TPR) repeat protein